MKYNQNKLKRPRDLDDRPHLKKILMSDKTTIEIFSSASTPMIIKNLSPHSKALCLFSVYGDGHCFFRAILSELKGSMATNDEVKQLRKIMANYFRLHSEEYQSFLDETETISNYASSLEKDLWGGEIEMQIVSKILDLDLLIYEGKYSQIDNLPSSIKLVNRYQASTSISTPIHLLHLPLSKKNNEKCNHYDLLSMSILPEENKDSNVKFDFEKTCTKMSKLDQEMFISLIEKEKKESSQKDLQNNITKSHIPPIKSDKKNNETSFPLFEGKKSMSKEDKFRNYLLFPNEKLPEYDNFAYCSIYDSEAHYILNTNKIPENIELLWKNNGANGKKIRKKRTKMRGKITKIFRIEKETKKLQMINNNEWYNVY